MNFMGGYVMHCRGIESRTIAWKVTMLPLHQPCVEKYLKRAEKKRKKKKKNPRRGSNPQSPDEKSGALSIGPRGHS